MEPPPYEEPGYFQRSTNTSAASTPSEDLVAAEMLTRLTATPPPTTPLSNLSLHEQQHPLITKVNQVTSHPIVQDAYKYYQDSKRNHPRFNYAAGIVERAAIPVVSKIEDNLNNRHRQRKKKRRVTKTDKTETKRRLQFCLHLLRLANDKINTQVSLLQTKISERETKLQEEKKEIEDTSDFLSDTATLDEDNQAAQETKTEIIATVKKIIHVISNFKTSTLNGESSTTELRATIRDIILKLPSQVQQQNPQTNEKVFLFAKESLDMITRLTNVFSDQLEKAEAWIGNESPVPERSPAPEQHALEQPQLEHPQLEHPQPEPPKYDSYGDHKIQL